MLPSVIDTEIVGRVIRPMAWEGERGAIDDRDERRGHEDERRGHEIVKLRENPPPWLFEELHRQVARLLLHRGELAFASLVLDDLSVEASAALWARAERRLLDQLEQAARDQLVFPSSIEPSRRWDGPHKREVSLRFAERPGRFGRKTLSAGEFGKLVGKPLAGVPAGAFIELVKWKGADAKQQIATDIHPRCRGRKTQIWKSHHIVLGADLVEKPGKGWSEVLDFRRGVIEHGIAKVAHHGSVHALHEPLIRSRQSPERHFIVTPYASKDLPRFDREGGIAALHEHAATVHLTGLPRGHDLQPGAPLKLKRSQLARRQRDWVPDPITSGFPDCWIMVELSARPARRRVVHGAGSIAVARG